MTEAEPRASNFWSGDARLHIDYPARSVYVNGDEVALTPTEFDVLACLAQRAGRVVSTPEIIEVVWGEWFGPSDHVFVHIHHIRRKLGPCGRLIVTKRRAGYLLRVDPHSVDHTSPWSQITREYSDLLQTDGHEQGGIWLLVDRDRIVTWISDSIASLLGWAPADLIGKHPWVIAPQGEVEAFERNFPLQGGPPLVSFASRVRHLDGHTVPIYIHGQVILGADGRRLGGIGEWRLLPSDGTPSADGAPARHDLPFLLHYDGDHVLTAVEPHQPFLGWDPDDVIGTHFSLAGFDRQTTEQAMASLITQGSDQVMGPTAIRRPDGTSALVDIRLRIRVEDGTVQGYVGEVRVLD